MPLNLRALDLNLLPIFEAIYAERSISRAARRLNLSQPTVSNALARLRTRLGDPLFERGAQGMVPTPRAKALADPVRQALAGLERGLRAGDGFDVAGSEREFVIAVEDYGETVLLPRLADALAHRAPGIRITIRPEPSARLLEAMRDGAVDLALDYFAPDDPRFRADCVLTDSLVTLSRRGHPMIGGRLGLDTYLSLRHVVLMPRADSRPMIDLALAKRGRQRRIAVTVPHFMSMPLLIQDSDLVCTLPRRMAQCYADHFELQTHPLPLRVPDFPIYLIWHESAQSDAGHQWLRRQLAEFCAGL